MRVHGWFRQKSSQAEQKSRMAQEQPIYIASSSNPPSSERRLVCVLFYLDALSS